MCVGWPAQGKVSNLETTGHSCPCSRRQQGVPLEEVHGEYHLSGTDIVRCILKAYATVYSVPQRGKFVHGILPETAIPPAGCPDTQETAIYLSFRALREQGQHTVARKGSISQYAIFTYNYLLTVLTMQIYTPQWPFSRLDLNCLRAVL